MSKSNLKHESRPLLTIIESLGETEWRKGSPSQMLVFEKGKEIIKDYSSHPPAICFRFKKENPEITQRLQCAVKDYKGKIRWEMSGRQRENLPGFNWCIEPSRVYEIQETARNLNLAPNQYMAIYEPEFGPVAYEDLIGLTEYIRSTFSDILSNVYH